MHKLTLLGTLGCHLCETAQIMLQEVMGDDIEMTHLDIAEDEALFTQYGVHIPVLWIEFEGQKRELFWPFQEAELVAAISSSNQRRYLI